jgi:hypothetical protein
MTPAEKYWREKAQAMEAVADVLTREVAQLREMLKAREVSEDSAQVFD